MAEQRHREGRELPKVVRVLALGSVTTGGRRLGREKEDVGGRALGKWYKRFCRSCGCVGLPGE